MAWPALVAAAWAAGCSSASTAPAVAGVTPGPDGGNPAPGGDGGLVVLPNGCPTGTGYMGDENCLPPPSPDQGFQLHYGPPDYTVANDMQPFLLQPGQETVDCFFQKTPNTEDRFVSGMQFYMRPGSHHLLVNLTSPHADGFDICGLTDGTTGGLGASQTPRVDALTDPAPENAGLAIRVPAHAQTVINFHVLDTGLKPLLREAWLNYIYMDPSQVRGIRGGIGLTGGLGFSIEPGTHKNYTYACSPERPVRILALAAHMHMHAQRMTAWKVSGGEATMVYQAFDWAEPPSFHYDSVTTNPVTDAATRKPGAITGQLTLSPGESLQWECEIDNPGPDTLTFRNEVKTGEMCLLGGSSIATDDPMTPYDFICTRN
jgi:hypothetical protein